MLIRKYLVFGFLSLFLFSLSGVFDLFIAKGDEFFVDTNIDGGSSKNVHNNVKKFRANFALSSMDKSEFEQIIWTKFEFEDFEPSKGDYFLVDIENALGYLINDTTRFYTVFPVMTGALRTPTPVKDWVVLEKSVKSDRITFGKTGEFFRMYLNEGATRTAYGIHGYGFFEDEISNARKFLSLGCVLVSDNVLDLLEESFNLNGASLSISTRASIDIEKHFLSRMFESDSLNKDLIK